MFGTNCLPKTRLSGREGAKRAHTLLILTPLKKTMVFSLSQRTRSTSIPESVTPQFYKESRALTARGAMSNSKSLWKLYVNESWTRQQLPFKNKPGSMTWALPVKNRRGRTNRLKFTVRGLHNSKEMIRYPNRSDKRERVEQHWETNCHEDEPSWGA